MKEVEENGDDSPIHHEWDPQGGLDQLRKDDRTLFDRATDFVAGAAAAVAALFKAKPKQREDGPDDKV